MEKNLEAPDLVVGGLFSLGQLETIATRTREGRTAEEIAREVDLVEEAVAPMVKAFGKVNKVAERIKRQSHPFEGRIARASHGKDPHSAHRIPADTTSGSRIDWDSVRGFHDTVGEAREIARQAVAEVFPRRSHVPAPA